MRRNTAMRTCRLTGLIGILLLLTSQAKAATNGQVITDGLTVYDTGCVFGAFSVVKGNITTSGAALYFHFNTNESGIVTDQSGSGNNGSVSGAVWTSSGYIEGAYDFNGTNRLIAVPASSSLNLTTSITMTAWVRFKGEVLQNKNQVILAKHQSGWIQYMLIRMANSGAHKFNAAFSCAVNGHQDFLSDYVLNDNTWYFLGATFSTASSNVNLYVNGFCVKTIAKTTPIYGDTVGNLEIGHDHRWDEYVNAIVDDVRIYNRELSSLEVKVLYNNTAAAYSETNAILRVVGGADIDRVPRKGDIDMGTYTNGP